MRNNIVCLSQRDLTKAWSQQLSAELTIKFGCIDDAHQLLQDFQPELMVLDIRDEPEALATVEMFGRWQPRLRTLLIVADDCEEKQLMHYLLAGAMGYVRTTELNNQLQRAILAVQQGQAWIPRQAVSSFINTITSLGQRPPALS